MMWITTDIFMLHFGLKPMSHILLIKLNMDKGNKKTIKVSPLKFKYMSVN